MPESVVYCVHGAANDGFRRLLAYIDCRIRLDARCADQTAPGHSPAHISWTDIAAELRLCKRMRHRDRFEIVVTQRNVAHANLLEVDSFGGPAVKLEQDAAVRTGDDRRRATRHTAVGNADTDRLLAGNGDSDNASRQRPAVGELGSRFAAGGSPASGMRPPAIS